LPNVLVALGWELPLPIMRAEIPISRAEIPEAWLLHAPPVHC
jgi:hypothetical protein